MATHRYTKQPPNQTFCTHLPWLFGSFQLEGHNSHEVHQQRTLMSSPLTVWRGLAHVSSQNLRTDQQTSFQDKSAIKMCWFKFFVLPLSVRERRKPLHEILHGWNARVAKYVHEAGVLTWSPRSFEQFWHLCSYMAGLPDGRWVSRNLAWRPPECWKTWGTIPDLPLHCGNLSAVGKLQLIGKHLQWSQKQGKGSVIVPSFSGSGKK